LLAVSTVWPMTQTLRAVEGRSQSQIVENVRQVTRMLMKRDGITLPALALRLGVSRSAVANRLGGPVPYSGKKPFTVAELGVLGEMFGIPPAAFIAGPNALIRSESKPQADMMQTRSTGAPRITPGRTAPRSPDRVLSLVAA
jgi:transcriptional regulator with XRE-family HTH domain